MQSFFGGPGIAFLLVSSPAPESLAEADYFAAKARELELPVAGFVLNRSLGPILADPMPTADLLPEDASLALREAWRVLQPLAEAEAALARAHVVLANSLQGKYPGGFVVALPELPSAASELRALQALAETLEEAAGPHHSDPQS